MATGTTTGKSHTCRRVFSVYLRSAIIIQYSFYKNLACFTNQLYYAFFTNFSSQTLFDGANLTAYNVAFTALPIFIFGLVARNFEAESLLECPELYRRIARNKLLSPVELLLWFLLALWHSCVIFFGWVLFWERGGGVLARSSFGLTVYTTLMVVVSLKLLFQARSISWTFVLSLLASFLGFLAFDLISHSLVLSTSLLNLLGHDYPTPGLAPLSSEMLMVAPVVFSSPAVWLLILLLSVLALLPDVVVRVLRKHWAVIKTKLKISRKVLDARLHQEQYQVSRERSDRGQL